jgi:hypothetical protein
VRETTTVARQQYFAEKRRDKEKVDECEQRVAVAEAAILISQVLALGEVYLPCLNGTGCADTLPEIVCEGLSPFFGTCFSAVRCVTLWIMCEGFAVISYCL